MHTILQTTLQNSSGYDSCEVSYVNLTILWKCTCTATTNSGYHQAVYSPFFFFVLHAAWVGGYCSKGIVPMRLWNFWWIIGVFKSLLSSNLKHPLLLNIPILSPALALQRHRLFLLQLTANICKKESLKDAIKKCQIKENLFLSFNVYR